MNTKLLIIYLFFFGCLLISNNSYSNDVLPDGPGYCISGSDNDRLLYKRFTPTGSILAEEEILINAFGFSPGRTITPCTNFYPGGWGYTDGEIILGEFSDWRCEANGNGEWAEYYAGYPGLAQYVNYPLSLKLVPLEANMLISATSQTPKDDSICSCWVEYVEQREYCSKNRLGRIVWDWDNCSGYCCNTESCLEKELEKDNNLGEVNTCN